MTDPQSPMKQTPILVEPAVLNRVGTTVQKISFDASEADRAALAERFGLVELTTFRAEATLRRRRDTGWIELKGTLHADVVQECVATLDPVAAEIEAEIDELFDDSQEAGRIEVDLDPVGEDPEPIEGDTLDIGDVITQILSLAIDPYPRALGAESSGTADPEASAQTSPGDGDGTSPFAALALLKDRSVKNR